MVELDHDLSAEIKVWRHVLEHKQSGSIYRAISSEAYTKEGLSPSLVIVDELHAFPTRELFDVLQLAMGARLDPLMLIVTTAGVMSTKTEDESILYQLHNYGLSIVRGEVEDPSFFMAWWGGDEEQDHRDESLWPLANPGLGDILDLDDMRSAVRLTPESEFRTKRLNLFVPSDTFWLPAGTWEACKVGEPDSNDWLHGLDSKLPAAVGVDIGIVHDASAVLTAQMQGETVVVRGRYWINPHRPGTVAHDDWRMPLDELLQQLRELRTRFPVSAAKIDDIAVPGPAYVYDRYGLASAELALEQEHLALIPVPQQGGWMVEASRRFYEAVLERRISHDGDPTLAAHLHNVVPRQVGESGWRLEKPSRSKKIDAAVAVVMAASQAMEVAPRKRFAAFAV
jgi:phage terminase large subunit-like protein